MAKLYFRYGAMGASKTANALMVKYNYEEKDLHPLLLQPMIANRDGDKVVKSRIGLESKCEYAEDYLDNTIDMDFVMRPNWSTQEMANKTQEAITKWVNVKNKFSDYDAVIVDECQFMTKNQVKQLRAIVDTLHIPVICYGLATDFMQNFFEGSEALMNMADVRDEIKTICWCGDGAKCNAKLDEFGNVMRSGKQVEMGGAEKDNELPKYTSLCRTHYDSGDIGPKMRAKFEAYYESKEDDLER